MVKLRSFIYCEHGLQMWCKKVEFFCEMFEFIIFVTWLNFFHCFNCILNNFIVHFKAKIVAIFSDIHQLRRSALPFLYSHSDATGVF